jgi:type IV pilus assembly protein PilE
VKRTHRAEIVELLSEQPQTLERYFSQNGNYNITSGLSAGNAYYTIAFVTPQPAALTYTLTATPIATAMMNGDSCGSFVITNTGARSNTGMAAGTTSASCWGR